MRFPPVSLVVRISTLAEIISNAVTGDCNRFRTGILSELTVTVPLYVLTSVGEKVTVTV